MTSQSMLNDALRIIRIYWGLSQAELADAIGVSQSLISEIENGKKQVSIDTLEKYSDKLGVRMSQIMFFAEDIDLDPNKNKGKRFIAKSILMALERILPDEHD